MLSFGKLLFQPVGDQRGNKRGHVSAETAHLLDDPGAEKGILFFGGQEDRLEPRLQASVHQSHLKLKLKIGNGPKSADYDKCILRHGEVHQEAIELLD